MSTSISTKISRKEALGWLVTIITTLITAVLCGKSSIFSDGQTKFLAITVFYIFITVFELLPNLLIAILLPFTYLCFSLAPASVVFNSWANSTPWLALTGLLSAGILQRIGLLQRLIYWCIQKVGCSYRRLVFALGIAGSLLCLISLSGGAIILAALVYSIYTTLHLENTKTGVGLMLAATMMLGANYFVYSPGAHGFCASLVAAVVPSFQWDYALYLWQNLPMIPFYFLIYFLITILYKQDVSLDEQLIKQEVSKLPPMSVEEKKGTIITIIFLVFALTTSLTKLNLIYIFILFCVAFFLPCIKIGKAEDFKNINFSLVFFISSFISIGSVASTVNFAPIISKYLTPLMNFESTWLTCIVIFLFAFVVNFLMTPPAATAALAVPVAMIAADLSLPIYPIINSFYAGLCELIFPYEIAMYLIFYAYGIYGFKDFAKLLGLRAVLHLIYIPLVMIPWWRLIGVA